MRIERRRHGRERKSSYSSGSTHLIKAGWDLRDIYPNRKTKKQILFKDLTNPIPQALGGFVLCRDSVAPGGFGNAIDAEAMRRLGYTMEQVRAGLAAGKDCTPEQLPYRLDFIIPYDAMLADALDENKKPTGEMVWIFPGTYSEQYGCWGGPLPGLYCSGDGIKAQRKRREGGSMEIACHPFGKIGIDPKFYCKESEDGLCKPHGRLSLLLIYQPKGGGGEWRPLADSENARFRFDSSSEYSTPQWEEQLAMAAARLKGKISGLHGSFTVQVKKRAKGDGGKATAPEFTLILNEAQIRQREREMYTRGTGFQLEGEETGRRLALPAPETDRDPRYSAPVDVAHETAAESYRSDPGDDFEEAEEAAFEEVNRGEAAAEAKNPEPAAKEAPAKPVAAAVKEAPAATVEGPLTVENAPAPLLVACLDSYLRTISRETDVELAKLAADMLFIEHNGKRIPVPSPGWFLQGETPEKQATREKALRDLCRAFLDDPRFELQEEDAA